MTYHAVIHSRDFQPQICPNLQPSLISWNCEGGPEKAILTISDSHFPFEAWKGYLRCPVEIYNDQGSVIWWGYIHSVRQTFDYLELTYSLDDLANRVAVSYTSLASSGTYGEQMTSAWRQDLASQAAYGVKEKIIPQRTITEKQALTMANLALEKGKDPQLACRPLGAPLGQLGVEVECRGWFETLGWKHYQGSGGFVGNTPAQAGFETLGNTTSTWVYYCQSFTPGISANLTQVQVRVRKDSLADGSLWMYIRNDLSGKPDMSGYITATNFLPSGLSDTAYQWISFQYLPTALTAGTKYWLCLRRYSTAGNYFLAVDENLNNPAGDYFIYKTDGTWLSRTPDADMIFKAYFETETTNQLSAIYVSGNQFLMGFLVENASGITTPPYNAAASTAKEAFLSLLRLGTSSAKALLADVTRERILRVREQPDAAKPTYTFLGKDCPAVIKTYTYPSRMTFRGILTSWNGGAITEEQPPVGQWVQFEGQGLAFIRSAVLDIPNDRIWLKT